MTTRHLVTSACILLALAGCGAGSQDSAPPPARLLRQSAAVVQAAAPAPVVFSGNLSQYTVSGANLTVTDNISLAVRQVAATDRLLFADTGLSLDLDGVPGQAYRIYQAAFNRQPDIGGLSFWIGVLDSGGTDLTGVAQGFIDSPEFANNYGSLSNVDFVVLLYNHVLHREPDAGGETFWLNNLNGNNDQHVAATRAQVLAAFSESNENKGNVLAAIRNGVLYYPSGFTPPSNPVSDYAGTYSGSFSGTDGGSVAVNVDQAGGLTFSMHLNNANLNLAGAGTIGVGGKFNVALSGANTTGTFFGSINASTHLATGGWNISSGSGGGGAFNASLPVTAPPPPPPPTGPTFSTVQAIIQQRCVPCHSAHPTMAGFNPAPLGIVFDTEAQIRANVGLIQQYAVNSQVMPYGNLTNMTAAERSTIGAWIAAGTP